MPAAPPARSRLRYRRRLQEDELPVRIDRVSGDRERPVPTGRGNVPLVSLPIPEEGDAPAVLFLHLESRGRVDIVEIGLEGPTFAVDPDVLPQRRGVEDHRSV